MLSGFELYPRWVPLRKLKGTAGGGLFEQQNNNHINRYQSISINRLILIIDDQSMAKIRVVIDWYRLSIPIDIDKLVSIGID